MNLNLSDKALIITGGGSGIGKAIALKATRAGGNVLIAGRTLEKLKNTAELHKDIEYIPADLANPGSHLQIIRTASDLFGRIDVLVNNAGMFKPVTLENADYALMEKMFRVNVFAPALLAKEALPYLKKSKGHVINVGSSLGHIAGIGQIGYGTSKGALEQLTRNMAHELGRYDVQVNCIAPGPTKTDILENSGLSKQAIQQSNREMINLLPLGRRGDPEEVADFVLNVCSPENTWVTGQVISIDGGMSVG